MKFYRNVKRRKISKNMMRFFTFSMINDFVIFSGLLLQSVLTSFKNTFIAGRATKFVNILSSCSNDGITKSQLFRLLGQSLCKCQPPDDQLLPVLNGTWKTINTMTHVNEFIQCIEPWSEYTSLHFGIKEINTLLGEIVARMNQNRNFEKHYSELRTIFDNIIENVDDYEALLISVSAFFAKHLSLMIIFNLFSSKFSGEFYAIHRFISKRHGSS